MQRNGGNSRTFDWRYWSLASLLLGGYLILAWWFPLLGHADKVPLADIHTFAPTLNYGLLYALLVCLLFGGYWLAYRMVWQRAQPLQAWAIVLATILFAAPLLVTYPVNAVDVFRYFFEGRMMVVHGADPLLAPPNAFATDPFLPFAAILLQKSSPYGPLWELTGAGVYWLSGGSVLWSVLLFKVIGLVCHILIGILIWQTLGDEDEHIRHAQMLLWLWNPALLFMFVMDAHNDILMLLFLVLGYQQISYRRPALGLIILVLAPLIKPIGVLPIPFFAIAVWQQAAHWKERLSTFLLAGGSALAIGFLAFLPFGTPLHLLLRLVDESQTGPSFSPAQFAVSLATMRGVNLSLPILARSVSVIFASAALILVWLTWRGRSPLKGVADTFAAYLATSLKFRIWYPSWLFPWLVLDVRSRYRLYAGVLLLLMSQLSVILYSHIRLAWLGGSLIYAHLIGVPLVFVLPSLFALLLHRFRSR